ncbi:S-adenosyl-L-methionine-dependent methyltransferase [Aaosphaeria arxii CBS 175.79]|uniref:DNA (cytosine-5-)-methyltransferase n=1 Tax=Aaosphaeria arxii CBS 175.79 TaxID=1450172 RepID=A0A6A5XJ01_9PLEO|nr:S-adenosyl-L-methionine-dependent methyltransferase [Aaosphaeria arxii CBS 175.79]KAF2012284.1 S-adenosyl-L-methionine-dependent methyltransferase [Aaosphaeria arxii CBS 175.79]
MSPSDYARNRAANWTPPHPITEEDKAIRSLKKAWLKAGKQTSWPSSAGKEVMIVKLHDFEIYHPPHKAKFPYELTSLHLHSVKASKLNFNGILSIGRTQHYVELVDIVHTSIEGYGDDASTKIYIQSRLAGRDREFDIWYELKAPCEHYRLYQEAFLWIATFAKHTIDYMEVQPSSSVTLSHFRDDFHEWLQQKFGNDPEFTTWLATCGDRTDFRSDINTYVDFLRNQCIGQPTSKSLLRHPVWSECLRGEREAIPAQPVVCNKTIATPFVYDHFKKMYFGKRLEKMQPDEKVQSQTDERKLALGFPEDQEESKKTRSRTTSSGPVSRDSINVGDVVEVQPDDETRWSSAGQGWAAYVQGIKPLKNGDAKLDVIWLYEPSNTVISDMTYLVKKELFFSDHCNCDCESLLVSEVLRKCTVAWNPDSLNTDADYIVRQKVNVAEGSHSWVTLKEKERYCCHYAPDRNTGQPSYKVGDCVYILPKAKGGKHEEQPTLEPVVIEQINEDFDDVMTRKLLRVNRDCRGMTSTSARDLAKAAPNELAWTEELDTVSMSRIVRKCHIRYFHHDEVLNNRVPSPYSKQGQGDYWFVSSRITKNGRLEYTTRQPGPFNQGMNPDKLPVPLRGMSLFSGGGNLDRGLEEGGAVKFKTAVDLAQEAIHTHRANADVPENHNFYYGSVDDYLKARLSGKEVKDIARIGDVQYIAAGSPCPGFSLLQPDFESNKSVGHASHVTTWLSFVDTYRPERGLMENVVSMSAKRKGFEQEKVFSQVVACLVGLGYQVWFGIVDSETCGSAQSRARLFISIAAPGLTLAERPSQTHKYRNFRPRSIGQTEIGENFSSRQDPVTPFPFTTIGQATGHLPPLGTGSVQACIPFPDHRVVRVANELDRQLIGRIPLLPAGQGYVEAFEQGLIPKRLQKGKKNPGKSFKRVVEAGTFPTVTTNVNPADAHCGQVLHYKEDRILSIQEGRMAQGIPDHEVLIGSLSQQWGIIGNAVDRHVAVANGLVLREAVEKDLEGAALAQPPQHHSKKRARGGDDELSSPKSTTEKSSAKRQKPTGSQQQATAAPGLRRTRHSGMKVKFLPRSMAEKRRWDGDSE